MKALMMTIASLMKSVYIEISKKFASIIILILYDPQGKVFVFFNNNSIATTTKRLK